MEAVCMIWTAVPSREDGERMSFALVEREHAACVQCVGPVRSTYRWKGKVTQGEEFLLLVKTTEGCAADAEKAIRAMHPYEVPEIVHVPVTGGWSAYLDWVALSVKRSG